MMFWGIPSRHRQSIIHSQWYRFLSFVHCAYCITLYSHCQEDFFFLLVLSVVLPFRRESVASRVRNVRCSEFFHPIHLALQMDSLSEDGGRCTWRRSVRVILDCPYCIMMYSQKSSTNLHFFGEKFCSHGIPYPRRVS